jgi:rubrerythrin
MFSRDPGKLALTPREGSEMEKQLNELLHQMLETELGGVQIYETALQCAINPDLKKEWNEYLEQTRHHVEIVRELFEKLGISEQQTPGRKVVGHIGESLVAAMKMAKQAGDSKGAELVACECVVFAETKDHLNWELLSKCAEKAKGDAKKAMTEACEEVEDEEDEHLYHSKGWCRELWIASLGMRAVLPPPEEQKDVKTAIGAARAEKARKDLM